MTQTTLFNDTQRTKKRLAYDDRSHSWEDGFIHPRWHELRAQHQIRTQCTCDRCNGPATPGQLHHTFYEFGRQCYEYPTESFRYLCEECHELMDKLRKQIGMEQQHLTPDQLEEVFGFIQGMGLRNRTDENLDVLSFRWMTGVAKAWNIKPAELEVSYPQSHGTWRIIKGRALEILAMRLSGVNDLEEEVD